MVRLLLIRHANSEHAARGLIAGVRGCTGLTKRGI
jgi:broad specificity phosphatase PhoE